MWLSLSTLENCTGHGVILDSAQLSLRGDAWRPSLLATECYPWALPLSDYENLPTFLANPHLGVSALVENICIYFATGCFYLIISLTYFLPISTPPLGQPPVFLCVYFCFMFVHLFCFSDFTYKWNDTVFILFCLIYFPWQNRPSRSIHVVTNGKISLFLCLSNIPLSLYTVSSLSVHLFGGIKYPSISWLLKMMLQQKERGRKISNYSVFIFFR